LEILSLSSLDNSDVRIVLAMSISENIAYNKGTHMR
jgi:hypothetical protein